MTLYDPDSLRDLLVALGSHSPALQQVYGLPPEYDPEFLNRLVDRIEGLAAAARRPAEAPEIEWCEEHFSLGDTSEKCEGILYYERRVQGTVEFTPCRMVRKLLVDPPKENQ